MTFKRIVGVVSFLLFSGMWIWTTCHGNPANALHISAQTGGLYGILGVVASFGFSAVPDILKLLIAKKDETK